MAENQNQQTDLTFPAEDFGLETLQAKQPMSTVRKAAAKTAARRVLGGPGQAIMELADPPMAAAPTISPIMLPPASESSTDKALTRLKASMWAEVPPTLSGDFEQVLTPSAASADRATKRKNREKQNQKKLLLDKKATLPGAPKNKSILLQPKRGVLLPPLRIGPQTAKDWIRRVEGVLPSERIVDSSKWYRSNKMIEPFLSTVGPEMTPEMESGFLVGSQQASPSQAIRAYVKQREQARRGVKFDDPGRQQSGTADYPLFKIAEGEPIDKGAGQKIHDFYDAAMQNKFRTYYDLDPDAGAPFVVDVHTGRDMGFVDDTYAKFIKKNYRIPKGYELQIDQPKGGWSETQYEWAANQGRRIAGELISRGWGLDHGIDFELEAPDVQAIGWMAMSDLYGAPGEDVPEAIDQNIQRVSAELSFGEGSPLSVEFPEFENLPGPEKTRVTREVMSWVGDVANELAGTVNIGRVHGHGGWQSYDPAPAMVESLLASPEGADLYADIVGYLAQQTEVWAVRPVSEGADDGNGIAVDILENGTDRITKGDNLQKIWASVNQLNPGLFQGFQPILEDGKPGIRMIVTTPEMAAQGGNTELLRWLRKKPSHVDPGILANIQKSKDPEWTQQLLDAFPPMPKGGLEVKPKKGEDIPGTKGAQEALWQKSNPKQLRTYIENNAQTIVDAVNEIFPGKGIDFEIEWEDVNIRIRHNDWTKDNNGERYSERIEAAAKRSLVDDLRNNYRPELEARVRSALDQAARRTGGPGREPDWSIVSRSLPRTKQLVLPGDTASTVFGEAPGSPENQTYLQNALRDYESARELQHPILDKSKRQHNFERWWNWDFEKDQPGDTPSAATFELFFDHDKNDFVTVIGPEQVKMNQFSDSTMEDMELTDPMLFFHGSPSFEGTKFDKEKQGLRDHGYHGKGFYFTPKALTAEHYAESIDEHLTSQEISGPVAKVFADPSQVGSDELTEQIDEFDFDNVDFYNDENYPKTAAGLKQYAEDQYAGDMAVVVMEDKVFSPEILPFYLSIKNPLNMHKSKFNDEMLQKLKEGFFQAMTWSDHELTIGDAENLFDKKASDIKLPWQFVENLTDTLGIDMSELAEESGFDAIVGGNEVVVFNPKQIKSAIGNIGLFNPQSDDFLTQLEQPIKKRNQQMAQMQAPQIMRRRERAA